MNLDIQTVKFSMDDEQKEYIEKKFSRIKYADEYITDVLCTVKEDKKFFYECTVNFKWGNIAHISTENYDFQAGVNKMMDMLDLKIKKEKEKNQGR
ncbi:MAG: ribosome biogenesis GTPase RsgA [Treponema sp.]|nr:MAG: ribosome biogenesis GTPase RsgA [Treponema sp.]